MHVLRVAQVFDGERFVASGNGPVDVALDGGAVVSVGPPVDYASDASVEDLGDATALPGLVDAHQHLTWDCSPDPLGWHTASDDTDLRGRGRENARRALAAGVTTVRDLGGRGLVTLALRDELAADPTAGPAVLAAGPALTTPGGHCWFLGGECADAVQLRTTVGRLAAAGVDVVKVMATGGNVTPGSAPHESQFGIAELRAVVESAHAAGLPVAAHAHGTGGVADALAAGVDTIEHVTFMTADGIARDPGLVERLATAGVPLSLTGASLPGTPPAPALAARFPALIEHVRELLASGARCFFSTDAGIGPAKPHDVLPHGAVMIVEIGRKSVARAVAMCTSGPADALGIGDSVGRLRVGARADVLVVQGRLSDDVSALLRPVRVLHQGVDVARPTAH
ncbi:amidohydrolase family protein [Terrabacter sp. 2RAF25]|uniref:amidohydrolase family protein n=1 Tax=Terrabacter sp. 2RAF25 TaxID=3232998 RepID=UPI003F9B65E8